MQSSMDWIRNPPDCKPEIADSRPLPGPLTFTSISLMPNFRARLATDSPARWAANGVLLRVPLKPTVPADCQHKVSPFTSVIVIIVLLNVALTYAMPRATLRRVFFFFPASFATNYSSPSRRFFG